ncbi:glycosyltransferase [Candidatus Dependentiae bacterium]|nr:glycosyltransferase [Candidatus Dependentiae bacterium]
MQSNEILIPKKNFEYWLSKNYYYHKLLIKFYKFIIPKNQNVLHVGCKNGYILHALDPKLGVGIDNDELTIIQAREKYPKYEFYLNNLENDHTFDYIIISCDTLMETEDIQNLFCSLKKYCHERTRIIIDWYSALWEPILWCTQKLGLKRPINFKNWISPYDAENFLHLAGFEKITSGKQILVPKNIPIMSWIFNNIIAQLPILRFLCLNNWIIAKLKIENSIKQLSTSVIVPCRNERGNIENAVINCPNLGSWTEIIFVEGNSKDGTYEEIERIINKYPEKKIKLFKQVGKGKGDAVRKGFANASGDILMILDADLTVSPQDLTKFYDCIVTGKGEFINGCRLVYGMESEAMRFLNLIANYCFGISLSWILGQRIKDSLCGTKVLLKTDYEKIAENRDYFGDFDPFGDFDLIFGAAKLNLKIVDMPIRYKNRVYGTTQISRFYHGFLLLQMTILAFRKFKFK